jgi:hypothetical protein
MSLKRPRHAEFISASHLNETLKQVQGDSSS